jgi:hypothetical protein
VSKIPTQSAQEDLQRQESFPRNEEFNFQIGAIRGDTHTCVFVVHRACQSRFLKPLTALHHAVLNLKKVEVSVTMGEHRSRFYPIAPNFRLVNHTMVGLLPYPTLA